MKDANDFLKYFVNEMQNIFQNGILIDGMHKINLSIRSFISDAPARAFTLGVKIHNGYFGCNNCIIGGDFVDNRVVFPELNCALRTDTSFIYKIQPGHLTSDMLLKKLNIRLVTQYEHAYE